MRYTTMILLFVLEFAKQSVAQDTIQKNHLALKIAPLAILDIDNTFQFAVEHRLKGNRWTLSEELGYGTAAANFWANSFNSSGSKLRENIRAKIEARKYRNAFYGRYVAYELFYKQINDRTNRGIGRECETGLCNYYEMVNYPINKHVVGISAKIGYQVRIRNELKKNTNFVFDFYVGAGLRRIMINHHDPDESLQDNGLNNFLYFNDGFFSNSGLGYGDKNYNIPHLALGLKIGYLIF
ncbi:hypothetical protein [Emticicia sp. BO119]|uniref:hypothetical protein n=1 Tax=Emticicia sp. BO119 TaxID=2757768 RepID=UPI0015F0A579|nr:hypothetical protein [Emticicia sp. BO119]MBA4854102.1 hypothetical protein [Emticicia sp. BO119]